MGLRLRRPGTSNIEQQANRTCLCSDPLSAETIRRHRGDYGIVKRSFHATQ